MRVFIYLSISAVRPLKRGRGGEYWSRRPIPAGVDAAGEKLSRLIESDTPDVFERAIWHEPGEQETTKQGLV